VGQRALYALADFVLELQAESPAREGLDHLLKSLSWVRTDDPTCKPSLHLSVKRRNAEVKIPQDCREAFRENGFSGLESGDDFYLTDGSSLFHLRPGSGEGYARLDPSFFKKSALLQANFWCFGLLKLLRPLGIYSLHGAGLATRDGAGLLLVGASGSGKSTLAIGLIRNGWRYLSDDALLLRLVLGKVQALAFRKSFYIDGAACRGYSDLSLGDEEPDTEGGQRRRVGVEEAYPKQHLSQCIPHLVLFPNITSQSQSDLLPMETAKALRALLVESGPQLFDRRTMTGHLELLKRLVRQTATYQLNAGRDLYRDPAKLIGMLQEAQGEMIGADYH
jgi:hypothetical protein